MNENQFKHLSNQDLINLFYEGETYDLAVCIALTDRSGLAEEWAACDGESFESVLDTAILILSAESV